jgi:two-component system response regulator FlrC
MKSILVVDDDPQMRDALKEAIHRLNFEAVVAENGQDAMSKLTTVPFGMIITDMRMPKMDGMTFMKEARRIIGNLPVLVITGYGTVENAVEAMKEGATDYLMKPFSFDKLTRTINSIMERGSTGRRIITEDERMKRLLQITGDVAGGDTTVLITGESGTGKELIARHIHQLSHRKEKPFVAVNCAAIPDNLLESELFGHEKGSFTGATDRKSGKFEQANEGTILLDEIGEMPLALQSKLLRVLQEKEIDRIGGKHTIAVDIRVIATTNRDLYKESLEGKFREDLYYRLSVFPIHVPPLRERPGDIPVLADYFLKKYSSLLVKNVTGFTKEAMDFLKGQHFRGNIREFENVIHRAVLMARSETIGADDFMMDARQGGAPAANKIPAPAMDTSRGIKEMEKEMILKTLDQVGGNKTKAAKILGITVRTIRNKLNEYGLSEYGKNFPDE